MYEVEDNLKRDGPQDEAPWMLILMIASLVIQLIQLLIDLAQGSV